MADLLENCDLAHCMQMEVSIDGQLSSWFFDAYDDPFAIERMRKSQSGFGLASGAHRLDAYQRYSVLEYGVHVARNGLKRLADINTYMAALGDDGTIIDQDTKHKYFSRLERRVGRKAIDWDEPLRMINKQFDRIVSIQHLPTYRQRRDETTKWEKEPRRSKTSQTRDELATRIGSRFPPTELLCYATMLPS